MGASFPTLHAMCVLSPLSLLPMRSFSPLTFFFWKSSAPKELRVLAITVERLASLFPRPPPTTVSELTRPFVTAIPLIYSFLFSGRLCSPRRSQVDLTFGCFPRGPFTAAPFSSRPDTLRLELPFYGQAVGSCLAFGLKESMAVYPPSFFSVFPFWTTHLLHINVPLLPSQRPTS